MPIEATGEEMVQVCCDCFNDPRLLSANLRLEKTAYVPGEPIVYDLEIVNRSSQTIEQVHLLLYQVKFLLLCATPPMTIFVLQIY